MEQDRAAVDAAAGTVWCSKLGTGTVFLGAAGLVHFYIYFRGKGVARHGELAWTVITDTPIQ